MSSAPPFWIPVAPSRPARHAASGRDSRLWRENRREARAGSIADGSFQGWGCGGCPSALAAPLSDSSCLGLDLRTLPSLATRSVTLGFCRGGCRGGWRLAVDERADIQTRRSEQLTLYGQCNSTALCVMRMSRHAHDVVTASLQRGAYQARIVHRKQRCLRAPAFACLSVLCVGSVRAAVMTAWLHGCTGGSVERDGY